MSNGVPAASPGKFRGFANLARITITLLLFALVLRLVDWHRLRAVLSLMDWRWAAIGVLLTPALIVALAARWRLILRGHQIDLPFFTILRITWAGQFFNALLPGSNGGDLVKIVQACRHAPQRKASATSSVILDRLIGLGALLVLAGAAFLIGPTPWHLLHVSLSPKVVIGVLAAGVVGAALLAGAVFHFGRQSIWQDRLQALARDLRGMRIGVLCVAFALALGMHILSFFAIFLFARSLGIEVSFLQMMTIMPVVLLLVMLPVTVNGHGLREMLWIFYLKALGVALPAAAGGAAEAVMALSILTISTDLFWCLPGGLFCLSRKPRHAESDRLEAAAFSQS